MIFLALVGQLGLEVPDLEELLVERDATGTRVTVSTPVLELDQLRREAEAAARSGRAACIRATDPNAPLPGIARRV